MYTPIYIYICISLSLSLCIYIYIERERDTHKCMYHASRVCRPPAASGLPGVAPRGRAWTSGEPTRAIAIYISISLSLSLSLAIYIYIYIYIYICISICRGMCIMCLYIYIYIYIYMYVYICIYIYIFIYINPPHFSPRAPPGELYSVSIGRHPVFVAPLPASALASSRAAGI